MIEAESTFPWWTESIATFLWQGAAIGALLVLMAWSLSYLWRKRSAADRHHLWMFALSGFLLVPALQAVNRQWDFFPAVTLPKTLALHAEKGAVPAKFLTTASGGLTTPVTASEAARLQIVGGAALPTWPSAREPVPFIESLNDPIESGDDPIPVDRWQLGSDATPFKLPVPWWTLVWALGSVLVLGRILVGRVVLSTLDREPAPEPVRKQTQALAEGMGVSVSHLKVCVSQRRSLPMTWGWRRPKILLPREASDWSEERLEAVLTHELAHVKRRDAVSQCLLQACSVVFWFHPLVWFAGWRLGIERERACDDMVVQRGGLKPSAYARQLMDIATSQKAGLPLAPGMAMAKPSQLEGRIKQLLDASAERKAMSAPAFAALIVGGGLLLLSLGSLRSQQLPVEDPLELSPAEAPSDDVDDLLPLDLGEPEELNQDPLAEDTTPIEAPADDLFDELLPEPVEAAEPDELTITVELSETSENVDPSLEELVTERARLAELLKSQADRELAVSAQQQRIQEMEKRLAELRRMSEVNTARPVDPRILDENRLMQDYAQQIQKLDELQKRYLARHPKMIQQQEALANLERRLASIRSTIRVATPQAGIVRTVKVKLGDRVEKGAVLLSLDQRRAELALSTAKSRLQLADARRDASVERLKRLQEGVERQIEAGVASATEGVGLLTEAELEMQRANAEFTQARADLEKAELDLSDLTVRAPSGGEIVRIDAHVGEYVSPEKPVIHLLKNPEPVPIR